MYRKVIYGPPGTGKTTKLLSILENELKSYKKNEIAFCSYTKAGTEQGKKRAIEKFGGVKDNYTYFRTLHSLAFFMLNLKRPMMISKHHYKEFSKKMGMHFTGYYTEDLRHNDDKYLFLQDLHKNNAKLTIKYMKNVDIHKYNYVKNNFDLFKKAYNIMDFTDIIELFIDKNIKVPVKVAIIDEAQDLTTLQWKMIWIAFGHCDKVYIAGDDDQAIFEWNGADVDYLLGLKADIEILRQSYRLPSQILKTASNISKLITNRVDKKYKPIHDNGKVVYLKNLKELRITKNESWLFLSRNNIFLNEAEKYLQQGGYPYTLKDVKTIKETELNLIRMYEDVRSNRIMTNRQKLYLDDILIENYSLNNPWYSSFNWEYHKIMHYRDYFAKKRDVNKFDINVSTIHSIKGRESDNVVLIMNITKSIYENLQKNPNSEHRVFYVGATRAKKVLFLIFLEGLSKYEYKIYNEIGGDDED